MRKLTITACVLATTFLAFAGCSKKKDAPSPAPQAPASLAEAPSTPIPSAPDATKPSTDADSAPSSATVHADAVRCGEFSYPHWDDNWVCLHGVLRCLHKNGCAYRDGKVAPMRSYVAGKDARLYCDGLEAPADLAGLRCLDDHLDRFAVESGDVDWGLDVEWDEDDESSDADSHYLEKNRYLVCTNDHCGNLTKGERATPNRDKYAVKPSACDPTRMLPGTTCKGNQVYCGDAPFPSDDVDTLSKWRCVQDSWLCMEDRCRCGNQDVGKFGTCKDGVAICGNKPMQAPAQEGYICQGEKWVCAKPGGCGECSQYQSLGEKGGCEGKSTRPDVKLVECKDGNCPCGDGACPKGGSCMKIAGKAPMCVCGKYHEAQYCYDRFEYPVVSNGYGEFTCNDHHVSGSSGGGDNYWDVLCENPNGCKTQGKAVFIDRSKDEDEDRYEWWEDLLTVPNRYADPHKLDDYDKAFLDLEFGHCGRNTARDFSQTLAGEKVDHPENDSCALRTACDTMPVPRNRRKDYSCEFVRDPLGPLKCYSWQEHLHVAVGLRCHADAGCPCHKDTCAKGQLCTNGVCRYDSLYAQNTCQNVNPHLAPDEPSIRQMDDGGTPREEWDIIGEDTPDGLGSVVALSPSDARYEQYGDIRNDANYPDGDGNYLAQKVWNWDVYETDVVNRLVTANGTCLCGYSEVTPKTPADYKCVQTLGYVCVLPEGCECGAAKCQKGALCLREGLCSSVVMDKGVAPERMSTLEKWNG